MGVTLEEAIKIAEDKRGEFEISHVSVAIDCGDRWIFWFKEDEGLTGSAPAFVLKDSGECDIMFASDAVMLISESNGKKISLPNCVNK